MSRILLVMLGTVAAVACAAAPRAGSPAAMRPYVVVLGTAQDAGFPHAGCRRSCCAAAWENRELRRRVASIAIVDPASGERWILDATPDLTAQLRLLNEVTGAGAVPRTSPIAEHLDLDGILLTHAHVGHYLGLALLGKEGVGSAAVPVWAMPRMREFLRGNEPWKRLVEGNAIVVRELEEGRRVALNERISVTPFLVPHRDELSETVGYLVEGPTRSVAFVPDVDKWERWGRDVEDLVASVDRAYLDGTFFAAGEVPGRSMREIPHPFIEETMERLGRLPPAEREKVRFLHLNHTNPALVPGSEAEREIERRGFGLAREGETIEL